MENTEKRNYTEKEVIAFTINILEQINYPAFMLELHPAQVMAIKQRIIDPIAAAKANLKSILDAINRNEQEDQKEDEIDLGVIDLDEKHAEVNEDA